MLSPTEYLQKLCISFITTTRAHHDGNNNDRNVMKILQWKISRVVEQKNLYSGHVQYKTLYFALNILKVETKKNLYVYIYQRD